MKNTILLVLVLAIGLAAEVANADFTFGTPTNLGPPVNSSYGECGVCISANGLEFYFCSDRPGGHGGYDLWVRKRTTVEDEWGSPVNAGSPPNTQYGFWEPTISADGLSLYFSDGHSPQFGNQLPGRLHPDGNIWMITRETIHDAWGAPVNIGPAVNSQHAVSPSLSEDGLSLYFQSHRPGHIGGHCDIMVATRETIFDSFGSPVFLRNVNSADGEWMPDISVDGRTLFFCRSACNVLWMARQATVHDDFGPPVRLPAQINVASTNASPTLSADGRTLYFCSNRAGGIGSYDLWQVSIEPVVDFNGDGQVDCVDLCAMIDHWGTDEQLYDIGPMPWGDGIVDVQDLIVLAEHFEKITPDEEINVDEDDGGGQVELEQGQILVVTLESNPTTGYGWEVVETQESILEQMGEAEFKPSQTGEPPLVGAGGWEIFRFEAISAGQMTLQLVYRRPWEEGVEPVKTFSLQVVVR